MIKINLAIQKKRPPINIHFGWLFVTGYALAACVGLYLVNSQRQVVIEGKRQEQAEIRAERAKVQIYTATRNARRKELETLHRNEAEFARTITQPSSTTWTNTLLTLESVLNGAKTVWLRDLRIEGDGRVTLNGTSKENNGKRVVFGITKFVESLRARETVFRPPHLKRIQWDQYHGQIVAAFELSTTLNR